MKRVLLIVEGQHDVALLSKLCLHRGLERVRLLTELDPFWTFTVPTRFPIRDDLMKRVPVPSFFASPDLSIAIQAANGESQIVDLLGEDLSLVPDGGFDAIGIVLDADHQHLPPERYADLTRAISASCPALTMPGAAGEVGGGVPRFGIFVMPDNEVMGTLEDVLIEAAESVYPALHDGARRFIESAVVADGLTRHDLREANKPAGRRKAVASAIASVLKPCKAIQVAIEDCRWIAPDGYGLPFRMRLERFLTDLTA
mgnify:FL=1